MKKFLRAVALLAAMGVCFLAGWRVMPRVWPSLKKAVVYPLFPALEPAPAPSPTPYVPESSAALSDPVGPTDSLIYYFYKDYCPYCAALEPLTAGLPAQITLPDGTTSRVMLVCLNKNEEQAFALIESYYQAFAIHEERQYVPAVVIGDRYMMPGIEIMDQLLDALVSGEGLHTPLLDGAQRQP